MNLMQLLQQAQGGQGVSGLGAQFGMEDGQTNALLEQLAPMIGRGAQRQAEAGGLDSLLGGLMGEGQGSAFDDIGVAASDGARAQGGDFLNQIFGGAEATRAVAQEAATRANVAPEAAETLLPSLGAMLQGGMQRQMPDDALSGILSQLGGGGGAGGLLGGLLGGGSGGGLGGLVGGLLGGSGQNNDALGGLLQMLDADGDGSVVDDIMEKLAR